METGKRSAEIPQELASLNQLADPPQPPRHSFIPPSEPLPSLMEAEFPGIASSSLAAVFPPKTVGVIPLRPPGSNAASLSFRR